MCRVTDARLSDVDLLLIRSLRNKSTLPIQQIAGNHLEQIIVFALQYNAH
jgi:hypothetical protein